MPRSSSDGHVCGLGDDPSTGTVGYEVTDHDIEAGSSTHKPGEECTGLSCYCNPYNYPPEDPDQKMDGRLDD